MVKFWFVVRRSFLVLCKTVVCHEVLFCLFLLCSAVCAYLIAIRVFPGIVVLMQLWFCVDSCKEMVTNNSNEGKQQTNE